MAFKRQLEAFKERKTLLWHCEIPDYSYIFGHQTNIIKYCFIALKTEGVWLNYIMFGVTLGFFFSQSLLIYFVLHWRMYNIDIKKKIIYTNFFHSKSAKMWVKVRQKWSTFRLKYKSIKLPLSWMHPPIIRIIIMQIICICIAIQNLKEIHQEVQL